MKNARGILFNLFFTAFILVTSWGISLAIQRLSGIQTLIPAIFTLAVFLTSVFTDGYIYGIAASLLSVLAVNFAFTFPYFKFNFSITENMISAVIMFAVTIMTSALTTKVKQQEKMRAESEKEKMRANLLRAVSHDLRTPLTTIYGSSSAMIEGVDNLSTEQLIQLAGGIREDAEWMIGMVENLLSVTRIDDGRIKLVKKPVVLEELVDTVLVRFKKKYPHQDVQINIPEEFVSIPMDGVLIEQVLINILENAVQHANGMSELSLSVSAEEHCAVFEIADDGCGIPKERLTDIFTGYFEKKDVPVDNQKNSMGIGLSVCASIIKAHGGTIRVENRKTGGSIFTFSLDTEV